MRLILILLLAFSFPVSAQVYKWTDENGVTHFGSQPPPGQNESVDATNPPPSGSRPEAAPESDIIRQARKLEQQKMREAQERAEKRLQRTRSRISELESEANERPSYVCQGIKDRLELLNEDMEELKRQGYSISEKNRLDRRIKREEMHRDNLCR